MDEIAALVILYRPEASVFSNILTYRDIIKKIFIIDNSEIPGVFSSDKLKDFKNAEYTFKRRNIGIAAALNIACEKAINENFDFLLTMDQDSFFTEESIDQYLRCLQNFENKEQVSMFGINHERLSLLPDCTFNKVNILITSGSIINLSAYKKIGDFDENLFIDFVDTEYCFRSIQKGYEIIEFPNIFMHHRLGELSSQRSLRNLKRTNRSFHSSLRLYYMLRNFLYVNTKYKTDFKQDLANLKKDLLHRIKNKLIYKSGRIETMRYLLRAWQDFKNKNMGMIKLSDHN